MSFEITAADSDARWYVPEYKGNRDSESPFKVLVRPWSGKERARFAQRAARMAERKNSFHHLGEQMVKSAICENVIEVVGVSFKASDGSVRKIETGEDLWSIRDDGPAALEDLYSEILEVVRGASELSEDEEGNSESL